LLSVFPLGLGVDVTVVVVVDPVNVFLRRWRWQQALAF
jgi:hypothetical protein